MSYRRTAILYFSKSAKAESKEKILLSSSKANSKLHFHLKTHIRKELRESGLPVFEFSESNQNGENFGARITNAFQTLFDKGYDKVISVGSDCPELISEDILQAQALLSSNRMVVGPDQRGGAYLIGLTREAFSDSFEKLPWQSEDLLNGLLSYLQHKNLGFSLLSRKQDLNEKIDLVNVGDCSILQLILKQVLIGEDFKDYLVPTLFLLLVKASQRRGPPVR